MSKLLVYFILVLFPYLVLKFNLIPCHITRDFRSLYYKLLLSLLQGDAKVLRREGEGMAILKSMNLLSTSNLNYYLLSIIKYIHKGLQKAPLETIMDSWSIITAL